MLNRIKKEDIPVLFEFIGFKEKCLNCRYFKLDNEDYSSFPKEQEVLF